MPSPRSAAVVACLVAPLIVGCGSRGLVPVEGRVTFAGQPPPAGGYVFFVPLDTAAKGDGTGPRSGTAMFMQDGAFTVTTFKNGDGLRPGRYEARVECARPRASGALEGDGGSVVPPGFKPPEVTVQASSFGPLRVDIDVR